MDALPAPSSSSSRRSTEHSLACGTGLSAEDVESWSQLQNLAQAVVRPWVFVAAVAAMTVVVALLLWLGKAGSLAEVDSAELLVPVAPVSVDSNPHH